MFQPTGFVVIFNYNSFHSFNKVELFFNKTDHFRIFLRLEQVYHLQHKLNDQTKKQVQYTTAKVRTFFGMHNALSTHLSRKTKKNN